jgi:hypothetical protein
MDTIYMSPDPYGQSFEESIDLRKCNLTTHTTGGLRFLAKDDRLVLASIDSGSPGARIDKWCTRLRGAWLVSINDHPVHSLSVVQHELLLASACNPSSCTLLFTHPEITPDISNRGVPIMSPTDFTQYTHDELNNRLDLLLDVEPTAPHVLCTRYYDIVTSGDVRQYITRVMRLTRGRLLQQDDWSDWQGSEFLQLDQYDDQHCFGEPTSVAKEDAVFHLVWTYNIKALDGRKKARCVCDGSSRSGSVKVLDEVYVRLHYLVRTNRSYIQ